MIKSYPMNLLHSHDAYNQNTLAINQDYLSEREFKGAYKI